MVLDLELLLARADQYGRPGDQHRENHATINPFADHPTRISEFTAQEIATLQCRLDRQLGPEYISTRPGNGGGKVHYLAAEKVINLANEVFGFNGWSSAIQNVQIDFVDENTATGRVNLGLSTIVRVTLKDGTYHEDIGYGHCENTKGKAAAFEKAKKEAATDAMKRALRNFGNVLGNCLYDKDYLQKITKVKVAPSRWDAENLHRHPDYAPIKREAMAEARSAQVRPNGVQRNVSLQSNNAPLSEIEDEFGESVFDDGMEYTHPDEVRLDDTSSTELGGPTRAVFGARPANAARQNPPPAQAAQQIRPTNHARPSLNTIPSGARVQPPHTPGHTARLQAANNVAVQGDGDGIRSNQSSGNAIDSPLILAAARQIADVGGAQAASRNGFPDMQEQPVPRGNPGGFVAAKQADLLNNPSVARPANEALAFNPHAESPSIRRTQGINPGKSAPVSRHTLQNGAAPTPGMASIPSLNAAATLMSGGSAMNGAAVRSSSAYHAPVSDTNRRVGMPPPGAGPQNRGGYRPPTVMKRPAMTDVTNLQQIDGQGDAKKTKSDDLEAAVGTDHITTTTAHETQT
jgi:DNA repair and recombination protein RAD52